LKENAVYNCGKTEEQTKVLSANDEIVLVEMEARRNVPQKVEVNLDCKLFSPCQQNNSLRKNHQLISLKVSHVVVAFIFVCIRNLFHCVD